METRHPLTIPAAIVLGTAVVATALPLPSSTPATATGTAHVTRAYTDKSTHEPGKQATITAETSTGGTVHFSVSPDDGGRPTPLDFTTGTDEQGRTTLTFNVGRLASWDMVVISPATYADRAAAAPQAVDTSDNAAATDADDAGLVPATIVGQLRNGLGQCLTSQDPKGSNGTPVANSNCAGKEIVAYSISMCPNLAQQQEMLQILMDAKPAGVEPILHSDMGWQYQPRPTSARLPITVSSRACHAKATASTTAPLSRSSGTSRTSFFVAETGKPSKASKPTSPPTSRTGTQQDAK